MYKFKIFLFLFFIGAALPSFSNYGVLNSPTETPKKTLEKTCDLPAPAGLTVTNVTSNSITVQWLPVPGAAAYHVEAFDAITNAPLGIAVVSVSNIATVVSLPPATLVRVEVAAMCSTLPTEISINKSSVEARTNIVIEIVINGYNCNPNQNEWLTHQLVSGGTFTENIALNTVYYCEIFRTQNGIVTTSGFEIKVENNIAKIHNVQTNLGSVLAGGESGPFGIANTPPICTFRMVSVNTNTAGLNVTSGAMDKQNFGFRITTCGGGNRPSQGQSGETAADRKNNFNLSLSTPTISPNPFTDRLQVQFPEGDKEGEAKIQLFHINGTLLQTKRQALADGNSCELLTETLPAGMYLLRIETPEGSITRLVTKTGQ